MKNIMYIALFLSLLAMNSSCTDDNSLDTEIKEIESYLQEKGLTSQAQRTTEGVFYIITQEGTGTEFPKITSTVNMIYEGKIMGGSLFDSSDGQVAQLKLSQTIAGWQVGIPKFKKGSKGSLFIPSSLGYGEYAQSGIPAGSILHFDVEVVSFFE